MPMIRFMILLIPGLGIAALAVGLLAGISPEIRESILSGGARLLLIASPLLLGFVWVSQARKRASVSGYRKAKIIGARVGDGIGELTVEAGHSSDVLRDLHLPAGARVITGTVGRFYRVELPDSRKEAVEAVTRSNGYSGKVG